MIKKVIIFIAIALSFLYQGYSQSCGTHIPPGFFNKAKVKTLALDSTYVIPSTLLPKVNLSISVYVIGSDLSVGTLEGAIDSLNLAFDPTGISFSVCTETSIDGDEFTTINNSTNEDRLTALHSTVNTINLYLTDVVVADSEEVCGYTYLPSNPSRDYIFIDKNCDVSSTLIHEMGHFFGLLHTHETANGKELVDESNCSTAGDQLCDTKASPNLSGLVDDNCEYHGRLMDANDDYYLPSVSNHMSYSASICRCKFTPGQYQRMVEFYWLYRQHLH